MFIGISKSQRIRKLLLLVSSYIFYAFWDWRFLFLIFISTIIDFFAGNRISRVLSRDKKRFFLFFSIIANLSILGFFKYFNFFIHSANVAFGGLGLNLSTLNIILPVGISFYTFQTMSYTIDIYRGSLKPSKNILDFALFVAFFPQLVAGPIVRASEFLPQLKNKIVLNLDNIKIGMQIFIIGAFKKVVIADRMAYFVDLVFANHAFYDSGTIWLAVIAYSIQIYCDFSGYSDMAIGIARILGFTLPINFSMPYISQNISEFWRRWHISLSSWLRDYLYIPLGGNRKGKRRTYINLMLTMLLGGLWHGASWNFVFWGGWHGIGLAIHRFLAKEKRKVDNISFNPISWIVTLIFVILGWVFFRAENFSVSIAMLKKMLIPTTEGITWIFSAMIFIVPIMLIAHIIGRKYYQNKYPTVNLSTFSGVFIFVFMLLATFLLYFSNPQPFIYFQF